MGYVRPHIPYRNSVMTMVLRDSLGGNCRTVMIATISIEKGQIDESISTCRFAQRVAMVSNEVKCSVQHIRILDLDYVLLPQVLIKCRFNVYHQGCVS